MGHAHRCQINVLLLLIWTQQLLLCEKSKYGVIRFVTSYLWLAKRCAFCNVDVTLPVQHIFITLCSCSRQGWGEAFSPVNHIGCVANDNQPVEAVVREAVDHLANTHTSVSAVSIRMNEHRASTNVCFVTRDCSSTRDILYARRTRNYYKVGPSAKILLPK